jgi:hypothetical protein
MRIRHRLGARTAALVLALAVLASLLTAAATGAATSGTEAVRAAASKPKAFAPGKWVGSGSYASVDSSGPIRIAYRYELDFTMTVSPMGGVSGRYRLVGSGGPTSGGFTGRLKSVIDARPIGSGADVILVGEHSMAGVLRRGKLSTPISITKKYRSRLAVTSMACHTATGPKWRARRSGGGNPPTPASIKAAENTVLDELETALENRPAKPSPTRLRRILNKLGTLNYKMSVSGACGRAPAGYGKGLAGRADLVELFAELMKHMTSGVVAEKYEPYDIVGLVNAAVDAGLVGPGARNADSAVRSGLESWLNDALSAVHGRSGKEAVVTDIKRAAERAGMPAVAARATV